MNKEPEGCLLIKSQAEQDGPIQIKDDSVRNALDLLASLGYEIHLNGYRLKKDGKHSWSWWRIENV